MFVMATDLILMESVYIKVFADNPRNSPCLFSFSSPSLPLSLLRGPSSPCIFTSEPWGGGCVSVCSAGAGSAPVERGTSCTGRVLTGGTGRDATGGAEQEAPHPTRQSSAGRMRGGNLIAELSFPVASQPT